MRLEKEENEQNHLMADQDDNHILMECVSRYPTPLYLFDIDRLLWNVDRFRAGADGSFDLCFAMKANPFLVKWMVEATDRIEVCSTGEYRICRAQNIPPEKLLISGVLKKQSDIMEILDDLGGRSMYTAESEEQFRIIADYSDRNREEIRLFLRLTSGNQFGMDADRICHLVRESRNHPYIRLQGIHFFSGTQKRRIKKAIRELESLDAFLKELKENTGFEPEELEYGPGLSVPYFDGEEDTLPQDLAVLSDAVRSMEYRGKVTLEMGRAFAAVCGTYLTSVHDIKQNKGHDFCIVDGGIHQLNYDGQIRGMYLPYVRLLSGREGDGGREWTVCGALCTANDVLLQSFRAENLQIGDVFVFSNAGAYSMMEGPLLFLSHDLPSIVSYSTRDGFRELRAAYPVWKLNEAGN